LQRSEAGPAGGGVAFARALFALAALHAALWAALAGLPFQDVPNHVARAVVIGDLVFDAGRRFGETFAFAWTVEPYLLGDLLLLPLVRAFPADVAGRLWVAFEWASLPLAVLVLLRSWQAPRAATGIAVAFAMYLATDVFFAMGFANFRLAVALTVLAYAAWDGAMERGGAGPWLAYLGLAAAGYLMHLSALVFLVVAVGATSAVRLYDRRASFVRLAAAGAPIVLLLAWHVLVREPADGAPSLQPTAFAKLWRLASPLVRFRDLPDLAIAGVFVAAVVAAAIALARRGVVTRERELAVVLVAFVAAYFVLPEAKGAIWAIDNRALTYAWLWAALLAAWAAPRLGWTRGLAAAALAIAACNLALLAVRLQPVDAYMREYRALAAQLPRGAVVLPVLTQAKLGYVNPTAHAASFATIDRDAVVPYTFTGDVGMPMHYFRFRARPEAPWQFWYQAGYPPDVSPAALARYPYLLVELPADFGRIPVSGRIVRRNAAVAIVATAPGERDLSQAARRIAATVHSRDRAAGERR
jgi:hypothetical protein